MTKSVFCPFYNWIFVFYLWKRESVLSVLAMTPCQIHSIVDWTSPLGSSHRKVEVGELYLPPRHEYGPKAARRKRTLPPLSHLPPFSSTLSLVILEQAWYGDKLPVGSLCEAGVSTLSQMAGFTHCPGCKWSQNRFIPQSSLSPSPKQILSNHTDHWWWWWWFSHLFSQSVVSLV